MKLKNPTGTKRIVIDNNDVTTRHGAPLQITLEDFDRGSREFNLEVILKGENAHCEIQGRATAQGEDKKIWNVKQVFEGKNQIGKIELRGTASEKSFLQFDGTAELTHKSVDADAQVREKIILFDEARGKLLPILTVKTDKVLGASHSASIAPVSEDQLLYLQSRGISQKEAENVLREGFLKGIILGGPDFPHNLLSS
ncbi:SufD family Fe-S cluster assembly protein [Candidatus Gracilibacteria bacterium]|nr:SufD family Fe-S cluster assembly protein [Candidatus Gracilibacteria bacterium]